MNTYIFKNSDILVSQENEEIVSEEKVNDFLQKGLICDEFEDKVFKVKAARFDDNADVPSGYKFISLREYFHTHDEEQTLLSSRAKGLLGWHISTIFCQQCGTRLIDDEKMTALNCPSCKKQYFPRIEPAIIVLVSKGNDYLLVRHKLRIQNIWACVAGFVEIGESIEHAVVREVREEVGIEIKDLRYCTSQGWPFPNQLMLGFRAEYASGEIKVQQDELTEAKWFPRDALPEIPRKGSLGYKLISGEFN